MQATRTYLELTDRDQFKTAFGNFPGIDIARASNPSPDLYRMCYRTVGEAFHWFHRWDWSEGQITKLLAYSGIQLFVAIRIAGPQRAEMARWYRQRCVAEVGCLGIVHFRVVARHFRGALG